MSRAKVECSFVRSSFWVFVCLFVCLFVLSVPCFYSFLNRESAHFIFWGHPLHQNGLHIHLWIPEPSPRAHEPTSPRAHEPTSPRAHEPTSPRAHEPTSPRAHEPRARSGLPRLGSGRLRRNSVAHRTSHMAADGRGFCPKGE